MGKNHNTKSMPKYYVGKAPKEKYFPRKRKGLKNGKKA